MISDAGARHLMVERWIVNQRNDVKRQWTAAFQYPPSHFLLQFREAGPIRCPALEVADQSQSRWVGALQVSYSLEIH